jgi:adenine phosphoribosyltransferase
MGLAFWLLSHCMDLTKFIRNIPDFPKPGIQFKDITPLLANPDAFQEAIRILLGHYENHTIDAISAAEARGFLFAAPLAYQMRKPLVPLRKPGKLPYRTHKLQYDLEYGQAELHVHIDGFHPGSQVLLVDDLLATGGTLEAACKLIEQAKAKVISCAVLVELEFLRGREKLAPHEVFSLIRF